MSDTFEVRLEGMADLIRRLHTLEYKFARAAASKALRQACKPMLTEAAGRLSARHGLESGLLKKSLGLKSKSYRNGGLIVVIIGPRAGYEGMYAVPAGRVFVQVGGVRSRKSGGKRVGGKFGKTTRILRPLPDRRTDGLGNFTWPTMKRNPLRYAHLTEKGIAPRGGSDRKPFLLPSFQGGKSQAEATFRSVLEAELSAMGA